MLWSAILEKTVSQVAIETGITKSALQKALKAERLQGRLISPNLWLIDVDHPQYQKFLAEHQKWLRDRGRDKGQGTN